MLEAQTEVQFEDARTELRAFIDEKEKRQSLSNWLTWWATRKKHIFRAFKRKNAPNIILPRLYIQCGLHKKEHSSLCLNQRLTIFVR